MNLDVSQGECVHLRSYKSFSTIKFLYWPPKIRPKPYYVPCVPELNLWFSFCIDPVILYHKTAFAQSLKRSSYRKFIFNFYEQEFSSRYKRLLSDFRTIINVHFTSSKSVSVLLKCWILNNRMSNVMFTAVDIRVASRESRSRGQILLWELMVCRSLIRRSKALIWLYRRAVRSGS